MSKFWKMVSFKSKIAMSLSIMALIAAVVGIFVLKTEMKFICLCCVTIVWAIDYWVVVEENIKLIKEQHAKDYEIESLKWSYRKMGSYIDDLHIAELCDIDFRIENELRDIEIRKEHLYGDKS